MRVLDQFDSDLNVAIIGASGGIGRALVARLLAEPGLGHLCCFSRQPAPELPSQVRASAHSASASPPPEPSSSGAGRLSHLQMDPGDEHSVLQGVAGLGERRLDLLLVATGMLHGDGVSPEKSIRQLQASSFEQLMRVNTLAPMLVAKHFLPRMNKERKTVFAAISARVGSISDNRLGGWYSYRASKAALNMMLKCLSIEARMCWPRLIVAGLHPGTVATGLSAPFQKNVAAEKLFTADQSATYLLQVVNGLEPEQSGKVFAWDGSEVPA